MTSANCSDLIRRWLKFYTQRRCRSRQGNRSETVAIANFSNLKKHSGKPFPRTEDIDLYPFPQGIENLNAIA
ncbi:hypothetical protein FD724_22610 [Nostoc sp. C057]|uniref:hypothetical protein n=1 Tax=Nostoc sp. C057 TaxID=2576903 RepID=UPI0015C3E6BD|nr:hypothetical protein [Nostoc sp. C057]QLE50612.1 hypothetical protein FD724_22610 [Nostoc sp. C057]